MQKLDIGIALAHFMLALEEVGIAGAVTVADPGLVSEQGMEYIISWKKV